MGMHRWLLGPLICLILATTSARPPECQQPPPWSINGQQPLAETKGKASMLETLLKHFRSYGMEDLEFIIVNSKLSHSQDKFEELTKRVSFDVYQETDEEEVWSVMEGGKDDMFVYDRCGRLTYYVPFPLSILNESPLVSNAILATYFRSPCGDNCDQNKTLEIDDFVTDSDRDYETSNVTEEDNSTFTETEQSIYSNETTTEVKISNELIYVTTPVNNETDVENLNSTQNFTDYDYPTYDNNLQVNETNATDAAQAKSFFSSIYKLFFNSRSNGGEVTENRHFNETSLEENMHQKLAENETASSHVHHMHHGHHQHNHEEETHIHDIHGKKKSDRCAEADYEVCKSWSKKRLLHAQRCCSESHSDPESLRSCHHFGKKRCKKLQSILKCCIKTVYTEPALTDSPSEEPTGQTEEVITTTTSIPTQESSAVTIREEQVVTTEVTGITCCKTVNRAKVCRVSYSGSCEIDEFVDM